jgi:hypothetical protein
VVLNRSFTVLTTFICVSLAIATRPLQQAQAQATVSLSQDGRSSEASVQDASASWWVDAPSALRTASHPDSGSSLPGDPSITAQERHENKIRSEAERNTECETGQLRGKLCRVSWPRVLGSSLIVLAAQHGGNIWMDRDTRFELTHGSFWGKYVYCVEHYRWWRWKDDDPFGVDYIGHPMMGALTNSIYEQNDPKQRALSFENTHRYWIGRLRATAYSAVYSAQWKVGPASEASIGNTGISYYVRRRDGVYTNETGMQDFFITPIGGLAWNVGEDVIDRYIFSHVRHAHPRNRPLLFVASLMTPGRSAANVARFRAPYYRDQDLRSPDEIVH